MAPMDPVFFPENIGSEVLDRRSSSHWTNAQVLLRFVLLQIAAMSALLMLFVKIR